MGIEANVTNNQITASVGETQIDVSVSGGSGPTGPQGPAGDPGSSDWNDILNIPSTFQPESHAATHGQSGSDPVTLAISQVDGLDAAMGDKLALDGGAMKASASVTFSDGTHDSAIGGWGFAVELTADNSHYALIDSTGFTVESSNATSAVTVSGITNSGDGYISGIMGWGDPSGTKWSDLNGTYVRTSVAVRPSAYTDGNQGMHTPAAGTYNYYLSNPILMGSPNAAWNGIAYFLAPGNRSGWGDANNDGQTDPPVNYWRLCVLDDWPFTYFTNPSSDPYTFPTTGWVPVSASAPTPNEGAGYNGADYLGSYGGGFSVAASGGSSTLSSSALTITGVNGSAVISVAGLTLPNATHVRVGSFDNSTGGQGGISLVCAVGNELNWQGGRLRNVQVGGDGSPQPITSDSSIIFPGDGVSDVEIGAAGLTFSDGSSQTVAWTGSISYNDLDDLPTLFDGSYATLTGVPSQFDPYGHKASHELGGSDEITADNLPVVSEFVSTAEGYYSTLGQALLGLDDAIVGKASASHSHGNVTNDGKIGDTSGLLVVTTTDGVLTTSTIVDAVDGIGGLPAANVSGLATVATNGDWNSLNDKPSEFPPSSHNQAWSTITDTPTTLSGYGITDGGGGGVDPTAELTCSKLTVVANGGAQTANGDNNACFVLDNGSNATNAWFNFSGNDSDDPGTNCTLGFTGDGNFFHGITYVIPDNRLTISPDGANGNPQNGLTVDAAGNVGIGTVAPTQTLEVAGAVKCEKLVLGEVAVDGGGDAGEIRFYGGHFYGYDGSDWIQLDN